MATSKKAAKKKPAIKKKKKTNVVILKKDNQAFDIQNSFKKDVQNIIGIIDKKEFEAKIKESEEIAKQKLAFNLFVLVSSCLFLGYILGVKHNTDYLNANYKLVPKF